MTKSHRWLGIILLGLVMLSSGPAAAKSTYFAEDCASCHTDDTQTCDGCHHHGGVNHQAFTDLASYLPGEDVIVSFNGGTESGWIRAILYDDQGIEIARSTGPDGEGDAGSGSTDLEFPVFLTAPAPADPGFYTWAVSWFGSFDGSLVHGESAAVETNVFEVSEPTSDLTSISLNAPANGTTPGSAPTFSWTPDGGVDNAYSVELYLAPSGPLWSTYNNQGILIRETSWTLPDTLWNFIPSGSTIRWRVKGADLAQNPISIITSDQTWTFFKP
ncbi:MAG: hypothetical protein U9Q81_19690 [Pseudomonadota bacterium]|nr:hypothetical protein [Pseudomonadota bacterium]